MAELLAEKLKSLRKGKGWSIAALSHATARVGDTGVGERTLQLLESKAGRVPDAEILEALARAFDISPEEFYEWPIAAARRDAGSTPAAGRRRAVDAARKAAQRRSEQQTTSREDPDENPGSGQAA